MRHWFLPVAVVSLAAPATLASPQGLEIFVNVNLHAADGNYDIVDSLNPFSAAQHNLGGTATLLTAQVDFVSDVMVTSTVSTVGNLRTITLSYESVTDGNIFLPGHEGLFQASDFYRLSFLGSVISDADRIGPVDYMLHLLDVNGSDFVDAFQYDGFLDDLSFIDDASLASSDFLGTSVRGLSASMTYAVPAPASLGIFAIAGLISRRRR